MHENLPESFLIKIDVNAVLKLFPGFPVYPGTKGTVITRIYHNNPPKPFMGDDDLYHSVIIEVVDKPAEITLQDIQLIEAAVPLIGKYCAIYQVWLNNTNTLN